MTDHGCQERGGGGEIKKNQCEFYEDLQNESGGCAF